MLRERNPAIASPSPIRQELLFLSYYTSGELRSEGSSVTVGIGQGRITSNLEGFTADFSLQIPDNEAIAMVFLRQLSPNGL